MSFADPKQPPGTQDEVTLETLKADLATLAASVQKLATNEFEHATQNVQDTAGEKVSEIEASIRKNPTQATLIAGGIGFVVGFLLTR